MRQPSASTAQVLRWAGRVLGVLIILFFAGLAFSEHGLHSLPDLHLTRDMLPANWIITMVSYILAWKWERVSGIVILAMYLVHGLLEPEAFLVPFWIVMAIPGLLFVTSSLYRGKDAIQSTLSPAANLDTTKD